MKLNFTINDVFGLSHTVKGELINKELEAQLLRMISALSEPPEECRVGTVSMRCTLGVDTVTGEKLYSVESVSALKLPDNYVASTKARKFYLTENGAEMVYNYLMAMPNELEVAEEQGAGKLNGKE